MVICSIEVGTIKEFYKVRDKFFSHGVKWLSDDPFTKDKKVIRHTRTITLYYIDRFFITMNRETYETNMPAEEFLKADFDLNMLTLKYLL